MGARAQAVSGMNRMNNKASNMASMEIIVWRALPRDFGHKEVKR